LCHSLIAVDRLHADDPHTADQARDLGTAPIAAADVADEPEG
jgi:hypothetical protein